MVASRKVNRLLIAFCLMMVAAGIWVQAQQAKQAKRAQIAFMAGNALYSGQVKGAAMEGTAKTGDNTQPWTATRAGK